MNGIGVNDGGQPAEEGVGSGDDADAPHDGLEIPAAQFGNDCTTRENGHRGFGENYHGKKVNGKAHAHLDAESFFEILRNGEHPVAKILGSKDSRQNQEAVAGDPLITSLHQANMVSRGGEADKVLGGNVGQQHGSGNTQIPEQQGHNTFSGPFTCQPLYQKPSGKQ